MTCVSEATEAELKAANRAFVRSGERHDKDRERLHAAIVAHKADGAKVSQIEDIVIYRRGRITSILDDAGLVEKKPRAES